MDERDAKIKSDMENARNNSADVEGMLEEAKHIIAEAKKEAASIRDRARNEAIQAAEAKLSEAKGQVEVKYNDFVKSLEDEKAVLESSLISQIPVFKDSLTKKLSSI
jgi:F-type H+-transporting ATPase subunit b